MVWNTKKQKQNGKQLHVHHYFLALIVMSFISLQTGFLTMIQGFFHGMFIEGGCRWGYDAIWTIDDHTIVGKDGDGEHQKTKESAVVNLPPELLALIK